MALFRPTGMWTSDTNAKPTKVYSVGEMLAFRDAWPEPLEDLNVEAKLYKANAPSVPVAALVKSDKGFKTTSSSDLNIADKLVREVQSCLNKLTADNFGVLIQPLLQPSLFEPNVVSQVVARIFDKSLEEALYANVYAKMCLELATYEHSYLPSAKTIRTSIIERAQAVFEAQAKLSSTLSEDKDKLRKKKIANIKFIGCLFRLGLLANRVIASILRAILMTDKPPAEIDLEVTVCLLDAVGDIITDANGIDQTFIRLEDLMKMDKVYCARVRFCIMNLLDLRRNKWVRPQPAGDQMPKENVPQSPTSEVPDVRMMTIDNRPPLPPTISHDHMTKIAKLLSGVSPDSFPTAVKQLATQLSDQNPTMNRMTSLYAFVSVVAKSSKPEVLADAHEILKLPFDATEVRAGLAWAVTVGVMEGVSVDCPKFFMRLGSLALGVAKDRAAFKALVKDVINTGAQQLEAIYRSHFGGPEWEEEYTKCWDGFMHAAKLRAAEEKGVVPPLSEILDTLAVNRTDMVIRILPDMLNSIVTFELCTWDDLRAWKSQHERSAKLIHVVEALNLLAI